MKKALFNKISIIQSLFDNDLHTGTKIKEDIELFNFASKKDIRIELFDANTKKEFFGIINNLIDGVLNDASFPILHIEAHGSSDKQGIVLQSNEFISWADLKPCLIKLNTATRLNLLVVFSLCHGAYFSSHFTPSDIAPCWGLIGPTKALGGPALLRSFSAFYKEFFASGSGDAAVEKLNESSPKGDLDYLFTTATTFFINVYKDYLKEKCTEKSYDERALAMRKKLEKDGLHKIPSLSNIINIGELKRRLKSPQKDFFEEHKTKYFMIDLFPENKKRFKVTYQDVIK